MRFVHLSEGGFQVVYPLGLWFRFSKLSDLCADVASTLVYIYSTFTFTLVIHLHTFALRLRLCLRVRLRLRLRQRLRLSFNSRLHLRLRLCVRSRLYLLPLDAPVKGPFWSARLKLSRGGQHSPYVSVNVNVNNLLAISI